MKKLLFILSIFISAVLSAQNTHIPTGTFIKDSLNTNYSSSPIFVPWNTFRTKRVSLNGVDSVYGSGDSYMTGFNGYATYSTRCDAALLAQREGLTLVNDGVGGTGGFSAALLANEHINPVSNHSLIYVRFGFNDLKRAVYYNLATYKKIASCLSSIIANNLIDSLYFIDNAHVTRAGSWTNVALFGSTGGGKSGTTWGGNGAYSHTSGDSLITYINGDAVVIGYVNQVTGGFTGGNFNYYVDDSLAGNQVCDGADGISDGTYTNNVTPGALLISGMGSGTHKITLKLTTATYTYFDYIATVKSTKFIAPILVSLIPHLLAAGYAVSPAVVNGNAAFDSGDSTILATALKWEAYNVAVAYPMDYFNPNTDISGDNVHPLVPQGYQHLAQAAYARVSRDNTGRLGIFQYGNAINPIKSGTSIGVLTGGPYMSWYNYNATSGNKFFDVTNDNSGIQHWRVVNDAGNTAVDWMTVARNANVVHVLNQQVDSILWQANAASTNTFELRNLSSRVRINSMLQLNSSPVVGNSNFAFTVGTTFIRLPTITANRNLSINANPLQGDVIEILDSNTNASFAWILTPVTALDPQNNTISTLTNGTYYRFIFDGLAWREQFQYSSATAGGSNIYNTDGTLTANRTLSAGGFNLSLGATGSKLTSLTINSSAGISTQGQLQYGIYQPGDANITVPNNVSIVELPIITANRTITLPTMVAGSVITFYNTNTSNTNQWSFTNTVVDANGANNISTLRSGRSYDVLYDGTIYILKDNGLGIPQQTLFTQTATVTVANSSAATSLIGAGVGSMTVPANFFYPGKTIRIKVAGVYGLLTATPGNLTVNLKIGSTTIATGVISNFITTAPTNQGFAITATVTCRTTGAGGTVMTDGMMTYENNATSLSPRSDIDLNNAGATTTVNTTGSLLIDCTIQWATANAANTISATSVQLESIN